MTRSVEIPEAAVEAARQAREACVRSIDWAGDDYPDPMRAALTAALPYLVPAEPEEREQLWPADAYPEHMAPTPAGDGGLREALEKLAESYAETTHPAAHFAASDMRRLLAAHPAAPAVPQPAWNEIEDAISSAWATPDASLSLILASVRNLLPPASTVPPQPVDREALIMALSPVIGLLVRATNPVSLAQRERMTKLNAGKAADAVLAVLAGEQEQVEP